MGEARALGKGKHISTGEGLGFVEVGHDYVTYKYYPDTSLFFFHFSASIQSSSHYLPACLPVFFSVGSLDERQIK